MKKIFKRITVVFIIVLSLISSLVVVAEAAPISNQNFWGKYKATSSCYFTETSNDVIMTCVKYTDLGSRRYLSADNARDIYMTNTRFSVSYDSYYISDSTGSNKVLKTNAVVIVADDVDVLPDYFNMPSQINVYYSDLCYMKAYGNTL